jgi:hypothetical protein
MGLFLIFLELRKGSLKQTEGQGMAGHPDGCSARQTGRVFDAVQPLKHG